MEFASLQDAYGTLNNIKKRKPRPRSQNEEGFAYEVPTDADRPAVKRMLEIPPLNKQMAPDDSMDEYLDESTKFQKKMTVNNSLPSIQSIKTSPTPSFFGAEPFTNPNDDTMAPFNSSVDRANAYMLESDFTKSFDQAGLERSAGVALPVPELRHRWKPLSVDRVDTAFTKGRETTSDFDAMKAKLDALMARLDDLEHRAAGSNPQMEMLSFIMTGLFLMFALDVTVRKSTGLR